MRHGESIWNKENKFTGWTDVDLSPKGIEEATRTAELLRDENYSFDIAYTSLLKRAIRTLWITLDKMDLMWIPVMRTWRLNERHYGNLQGLNKSETTEKFGKDQVFIWRRSYDIPPPPLDPSDNRSPRKDPKYHYVDPQSLPLTECLKDTINRVLPYWETEIVPNIMIGKKIIIVAHGNSLRALVKHLDNVSDEDITHFNIPTGFPLVYELDENLKPIKHYYLGDQDEIQKATNAVANQALKKK